MDMETEFSIETFIDSVTPFIGQVKTVTIEKELPLKKSLIKKTGEIGKIKKISYLNGVIGAKYQPEEKENSDDNTFEKKESPLEEISDGVYQNKKSGKFYLGVAPVTTEYRRPTVFFIDGAPCELDKPICSGYTLEDFLYAADLGGAKKELSWITVNVENIKDID